MLGRFFTGRAKTIPLESRASGPADARVYAIGDVHGQLDLLEELLGSIRLDLAECAAERVFLVFIGDLIDRGPDSAGVIDLACSDPVPGARTVFLTGNHEEMLLRILDSEPQLFADWISFGGYECVQSYGLDAPRLAALRPEDAVLELARAIPRSHMEFLRGGADSFRFGDYLFVHAGIRPGVPLDEQSPHDLRWIRETFLDARDPHGLIVVHGHTIVERPEDHGNRIAIDTGAYRSGRLTAVMLDGQERRYLQACDHRSR